MQIENEGKHWIIGASVRITCSGEEGQVVGFAQYSDAGDQVLIRYKAADGRAVQSWWDLLAVETF